MTEEEFDDKWKDYLEEGHYGLAISTPEVITYVDEEFEKLSLIPGFSFSQIKEKFGMARVYLAFGFSEEAYELENGINNIFKQLENGRK
jgi:hypothetical protein